MENPVKAPIPAPAVSTETAWFEWFTDDFYPRHGKTLSIALGAVAVLLAVYLFLHYSRGKSAMEDNKKLGRAYVALERDDWAEAEKALQEFMGHGPSGLARDKAYLFLGKVHYGRQEYDKALEAYAKVGKGSPATVLIYSGALHGRAACLMQKKDYAGAVKILDEFLSLTQRRTGDPEEDLSGKEVVDLTPSVPNALWKQALCYRELKQNADAKTVAEKILKAYPKSPEAQDAIKLLAILTPQ